MYISENCLFLHFFKSLNIKELMVSIDRYRHYTQQYNNNNTYYRSSQNILLPSSTFHQIN